MKREAVFALVLMMVVSFSSGVLAQSSGAQPGLSSAGERYRGVNDWLLQNNLSPTASPSEPFVSEYIVVTGEGIAARTARTSGEARLTAERAATLVAYRALAEILNGVSVSGDSVVKNAGEHYDVIRTAVAGFIKGAQIVYKEYNEKEQVALVIMKVGMNGPSGFAGLFYEKMLSDPALRKGIVDERGVYTPPRPGFVEAVYDGLIVDTSGQPFKPALINRILNPTGEVLYDPTKISQKILVENGCGEYTNSIEKAKAVLASRGVRNPMIVKAGGTLSPTDITVSEEDAVKIFAANQKTNFFTGAKVAFVLK
jgi:hypothetical protein